MVVSSGFFGGGMKVSSRGMLGELVVGCSCVTGSGIIPVTSQCAVVLVERVAVGGWVW